MSATSRREDCPDPTLLSQLTDGELADLDATAERRIRVHVAACDHCRNQVAVLERSSDLGRAAIIALSGRSDELAAGSGRSDECLAAADLVALIEAVPPSPPVERHLASCDVCLHEASEMFRMHAQLTRAPLPPVPAALAARVASRWRDVADESISEIVIRAARDGLELVRQNLIAPLLDLAPLPIPAPAMRSSGNAADPLRFRLQASAGSIEATVVPDGEAVHLDLLLRDADEVALSGERIFLRQRGRSLFSARTDESGEIHLPRIEPGVYEVDCTGIETSFRLDLRTKGS